MDHQTNNRRRANFQQAVRPESPVSVFDFPENGRSASQNSSTQTPTMHQSNSDRSWNSRIDSRSHTTSSAHTDRPPRPTRNHGRS
ncbi:MAG: hypothetical protein MK137_03185 [Rickettsiales bacterium]|nr:hypothetical protein [Rickettsiales bacterium]